MSLIRNYGNIIINLTKVNYFYTGKTLFLRRPFIEFSYPLTAKYSFFFYVGDDNSIIDHRVFFNSVDERDNEFRKIEKDLDNFYKKN